MGQKIRSLKIWVYGEVQGMGFRYEARSYARELGLKGFVRNEPDGSVYIETEGEIGRLKKLLEWCQTGSYFAKVGGVDHSYSDDIRNYRDFVKVENETQT